MLCVIQEEVTLTVVFLLLPTSVSTGLCSVQVLFIFAATLGYHALQDAKEEVSSLLAAVIQHRDDLKFVSTKLGELFVEQIGASKKLLLHADSLDIIQVQKEQVYVMLLYFTSIHFSPFSGELLNIFTYGSGSGEVYSIDCNGNEMGLNECSSSTVTDSCSHTYDVDLNCFRKFFQQSGIVNHSAKFSVYQLEFGKQGLPTFRLNASVVIRAI